MGLRKDILEKMEADRVAAVNKAAVDMDGALPEGLAAQWAQFFSQPDSLDKLFADPMLFPLQRRREMDKMHQEAASIGAKTVFEIGSDKGGGIYGWATIPTVRKIIACEIRGTPYHKVFDANLSNTHSFLWLPQSSYDRQTVDIVRRWLALDGSKIDCLFIDGDKSHFLRDFDAYLPLMNPKGIVFMHDIVDRNPGEAFQEVTSRGYGYKVIQDKSEAFEEMERESRGEPILTCHGGWLRVWHGSSCTVGVIYLDPAKKGSN